MFFFSKFKLVFFFFFFFFQMCKSVPLYLCSTTSKYRLIFYQKRRLSSIKPLSVSSLLSSFFHSFLFSPTSFPPSFFFSLPLSFLPSVWFLILHSFLFFFCFFPLFFSLLHLKIKKKKKKNPQVGFPFPQNLRLLSFSKKSNPPSQKKILVSFF